jgi:hypothetical protein
MLTMIETDQLDQTSHPTTGVRIGVNYHDQTTGKYRPRFWFDRAVADVLRHGLSYPRVRIDGTFVNGLRISCTERDGMQPTIAASGSWAFSVPVRRVRGREDHVPTMNVPFFWQRDETGPVLIIPRLPDALLPKAVVDKLPDEAVDPKTRHERADKRLQREMERLKADVEDDLAQAKERDNMFQDTQEAPRLEEVIETPALEEVVETAPETREPEPAFEADPVPPPSAPAVDLKEALSMVNELVDQLGDSVVLSIDKHGHVTAKRRVVQYIDL